MFLQLLEAGGHPSTEGARRRKAVEREERSPRHLPPQDSRLHAARGVQRQGTPRRAGNERALGGGDRKEERAAGSGAIELEWTRHAHGDLYPADQRFHVAREPGGLQRGLLQTEQRHAGEPAEVVESRQPRCLVVLSPARQSPAPGDIGRGHLFRQCIHRSVHAPSMDFSQVTPEAIAEAIASEIGRTVDYRDVETDGARRAAARLAEML